MKAVLIPVKDLSRAKQRLSAHLTSAERTALARAMLEDVFAVVAQARGIDHVFVVSSDATALKQARSLGWEAIPETHQISESDSVDFASSSCAERGVGMLLRLPIDIPLVQPQDIETMFAQANTAPATVLVPSRDGTGTNALLRTPPLLFPSHFGPGSFARHLAEAGRSGAHTIVLRNERIELDVDDLEDLRLLSTKSSPASATGAWLAQHGFLPGRRSGQRDA